MPILVIFYFGPYFLLVLPAYWLVRRHGRPIERFDLLAMFVPIVGYIGLEVFDTRQAENALTATAIVGVVVALCILFRGARSLSSGEWALSTTAIGLLTAIVVWLTLPDERLVLPLF